jgi:hypothetical protein
LKLAYKIKGDIKVQNNTETKTVLVSGGDGSYSLPTSAGTAGQVLTTDGNTNTAYWANPGSGGGGWELGDIKNYTANATWTKPAGLKAVYVIVIGAGGGGGGAQGNLDVNLNSAGAGGGAGGRSEKLILESALGSTESVTRGAGGGGVSTTNNGSAGGTSSFGSHCSATGGGGGQGHSANNTTDFRNGGTGGIGSGGDINVRHEDGFASFRMGGIGAFPGNGGSTTHGAGGSNNGSLSSNGIAGTGMGGGGSGASAVGASSNNRTGGAGANGGVIVYEYF